MKLIREYIEPSLLEHTIVEGKDGKKDIVLSGIFSESETPNRNKRVYPEKIMDREIFRIQEKLAKGDFIFGSCDHPSNPEVRLEDAAIVIRKLHKDGRQYFGEAKVLSDTPKGRIIYNLAKEGVKIGISSRALGSIEERNGLQYVKEDLNLLTWDAVADPSVASAIMNCVYENIEYFIDNGSIKENVQETYKNRLKNLSKEEGNSLKEKVFSLYNDFISGI